METKVMKLAEIIPADYNPRVTLTPDDDEYKALDASLDENELVLPLIWNKRTQHLVDGHQRLNVLIARGETETEVVVIDMPLKQEQAFNSYLNHNEGRFDFGKVADILQEFKESGESILSTGFTEKEAQNLLEELKTETAFLPGDEEAEVDFTPKKPDTKGGVKCLIGIYAFRMDETTFDDMIADVHEKVGFSKEQVTAEFKRRLFA